MDKDREEIAEKLAKQVVDGSIGLWDAVMAMPEQDTEEVKGGGLKNRLTPKGAGRA